MLIKRKIQFGAAVVIANGVLALTVLTSQPAFANPCGEQAKCASACQNLSYCQSIALPGCTATSVTCLRTPIICSNGGPLTECFYN
jgi:hypothetical protein